MKLKNWNNAKKMLLVYGGLYLLNLLAVGLYFVVSPNGYLVVEYGFLWIGLFLTTLLPVAVAVGLGFGRNADPRTLNWFIVICASNLVSMLCLGSASVIVLSFFLGPHPVMYGYCWGHIFLTGEFYWYAPAVAWGPLLVWAIYRRIRLQLPEEEKKKSRKRRTITTGVIVLLTLVAMLAYPMSWRDNCRKFCLVGHPFAIEREKVEKIELHWGGSVITLESGTPEADAAVELLNQFEMRYWLPKPFAENFGDGIWIYCDGQVSKFYHTADYIGSGFGTMIGEKGSLKPLYDLVAD